MKTRIVLVLVALAGALSSVAPGLNGVSGATSPAC